MKLDGEEKSHRQKYSEGWGKEKYSANRMREWDEEMKERKKAKRGIEYLRQRGWRAQTERWEQLESTFAFLFSSFSSSGFSTLILYLLLYLCSLSSVSFPPLGFQTLECCCFFNISFFPAGSLSSAFLFRLFIWLLPSLIFCLHSCVNESSVPKTASSSPLSIPRSLKCD